MKALAVLLFVVFVVCGIVSLMHPFPETALTDALGFSSKPHTKHPVLYFVLAVLSLIWLRFATAQPAR